MNEAQLIFINEVNDYLLDYKSQAICLKMTLVKSQLYEDAARWRNIEIHLEKAIEIMNELKPQTKDI